MSDPKRIPRVSCMLPTQGRPEFAEFACRNFLRQTWPNKELLIAASDGDERFIETARKLVPPADLIVMPFAKIGEPEAFLGMKWQRMLEAATGDWVTLWGDDDWYHPERLRGILRKTPKSAKAAIPLSLAIGLTLHNLQWIEHGEIYPGAVMVRRELAPPFPRWRRLVDTAWYLDIKATLAPILVRLDDVTISVCLYHNRNVTNLAVLHDDFDRPYVEGARFMGVPEDEARELDRWIKHFHEVLYSDGAKKVTPLREAWK